MEQTICQTICQEQNLIFIDDVPLEFLNSLIDYFEQETGSRLID
jgi:hypothetical protein